MDCRRCHSRAPGLAPAGRLVLLLWILPASAGAQAPAAGDERIDRLAAEVARMAGALDEERRARLASEAAREAQGHGDGALHAGEFSLRPSGFVQVDAVPWEQSSTDQISDAGTLDNKERFLIRRAHLRADAAWRFLGGTLELEASTVTSTAVRLFGAEVSARWPSAAGVPPLVMVSAGLLRIPFGFENVERDTVRLFLERSAVVRALFPGENDLGAVLSGGYRVLRWQLAAMNGHPIGESAFPALAPTGSKDVLGRVGIDAAFGRVRLRAGASALVGTGFHAGTPATADHLQWHDDNGDGVIQPSELRPVPGVAATPSVNFGRWGLGADLGLTIDVPRLGALLVYGEVLWADNLDRALYVADPVAAGRDLRELGFYAGFTLELTGWAAVGLRFDRYDPDADARSQLGAANVPRDTSLSTWAVAAAARVSTWGRLVVEYDHNHNALGLSLAGAPTTLGSDALTVRAQLVF